MPRPSPDAGRHSATRRPRLEGAAGARGACHRCGSWLDACKPCSADEEEGRTRRRSAGRRRQGGACAGAGDACGAVRRQAGACARAPWNRIDAALIPALPHLGFSALSTFGPEKPAPLPVVNSHVDVMDWHGTRGCRPFSVLAEEIVARLDVAAQTGGSVGLLTHHLVHDAAVWHFLERLFAATCAHEACRWSGSRAC